MRAIMNIRDNVFVTISTKMYEFCFVLYGRYGRYTTYVYENVLTNIRDSPLYR